MNDHFPHAIVVLCCIHIYLSNKLLLQIAEFWHDNYITKVNAGCTPFPIKLRHLCVASVNWSNK